MGSGIYTGIPNARDLEIERVWKKYGKKNGVWQDPVKFLQQIPRASKYNPWNVV